MYDFSGPKYWGVLNPLWKLCSIGKRQSPIDIDPDKLLFDPFLKNLHIDKDKVRLNEYIDIRVSALNAPYISVKRQ